MARLGQVLDALFGVEGPDASTNCRLWRRYFAVGVLLAVIIAVRRPDTIVNPQFYAEDGLVFFPQNAALGLIGALTHFFQGFPYVIHRLIAWVAGLGPVDIAPRVYATSAILITAFGLASFALPNFRHLVHRDSLRVLFAVAVVVLPAHREFLLGTAMNVGWYIAIVLTLASLGRLPRSPWRLAGVTTLVALGMLSTPLSLINLPLWGLRTLHGHLRRDWGSQGFGVCNILVAVALLVMAPRLGATTPSTEPSFGFTQNIAHIVPHATHRVLDVLLSDSLSTAFQAAMPQLSPWVALALVGAPLLVTYRNDRSRLPTLLVVTSLAFLALALSLLGRPILASLKPSQVPLRYALYPTAMLCLAILIALDTLASRRSCHLATAGVVLLFGTAHARTFAIPPLPDLGWPLEGPRLERMLKTRCPLSLTVPLNPRFLPLEVIWGSMHPATDPDPDVVVASLGEEVATLSLPFTAQCNEVSVVELKLRSKGPCTGRVRLDIFDEDRRQPIASASVERRDIQDGWTTFCLPAVRGAASKRYVAVVRVVDSRPTARLEVLGPRIAAAGGHVTASLRHGCVDRKEPTLTFYELAQRGLARP